MATPPTLPLKNTPSAPGAVAVTTSVSHPERTDDTFDRGSGAAGGSSVLGALPATTVPPPPAPASHREAPSNILDLLQEGILSVESLNEKQMLAVMEQTQSIFGELARIEAEQAVLKRQAEQKIQELHDANTNIIAQIKAYAYCLKIAARNKDEKALVFEILNKVRVLPAAESHLDLMAGSDDALMARALLPQLNPSMMIACMCSAIEKLPADFRDRVKEPCDPNDISDPRSPACYLAAATQESPHASGFPSISKQDRAIVATYFLARLTTDPDRDRNVASAITCLEKSSEAQAKALRLRGKGAGAGSGVPRAVVEGGVKDILDNFVVSSKVLEKLLLKNESEPGTLTAEEVRTLTATKKPFINPQKIWHDLHLCETNIMCRIDDLLDERGSKKRGTKQERELKTLKEFCSTIEALRRDIGSYLSAVETRRDVASGLRITLTAFPHLMLWDQQVQALLDQTRSYAPFDKGLLLDFEGATTKTKAAPKSRTTSTPKVKSGGGGAAASAPSPFIIDDDELKALFRPIQGTPGHVEDTKEEENNDVGFQEVKRRRTLFRCGPLRFSETHMVVLHWHHEIHAHLEELGTETTAQFVVNSDTVWDRGTYFNPSVSALCHWDKHGRSRGQTAQQYSDEAFEFSRVCLAGEAGEPVVLNHSSDFGREVHRYRLGQQFIIMTTEGRILTYANDTPVEVV